MRRPPIIAYRPFPRTALAVIAVSYGVVGPGPLVGSAALVAPGFFGGSARAQGAAETHGAAETEAEAAFLSSAWSGTSGTSGSSASVASVAPVASSASFAASASFGSAARGVGIALDLPAGVSVDWLDAPGEEISVDITWAVGLWHEGPQRWGLAALLGHGALLGPTRNLGPREAMVEAALAGLRTHIRLGPEGTTVTLAGPASSWSVALWLAAERAEPRAAGPGLLRRLVRAQGGLWEGGDVNRVARGGAGVARGGGYQNAGAEFHGGVADLGDAAELGHTASDNHGHPGGRGLGRGAAAVVNANGRFVKVAMAELWGPYRGNRPATSERALRRRLPREDFDGLAAIADDLRATAPITIVLAGPAELREPMLASIGGYLATTPPRGAAAVADPRSSPDQVPRRGSRVQAQHAVDSRRRVIIAWDLADVVAIAGGTQSEATAAALIAGTLMEDRGGPLHARVVAGHGLADGLIAGFIGAPASLYVAATVRGRDGSTTRRVILEELAAWGRDGVSEGVLAGARARVLWSLDVATGARPQGAAGRLTPVSSGGGAGLSTLLRRLFGPSLGPPGALASLRAAVAAVGSEDLRQWAETALHPSRRVVVQLTPSRLPEEDRVVLDQRTLDDFLRLMVDFRCPAAGSRLPLTRLLADKYGLSPARYVALTRVVARQPERLRKLNHEARQRCLEYKKLRGIMAPARVLALHKAVACGPGADANPRTREARLALLFRRYDIDPSVYRPLVALTREDPRQRVALDAIDRRCPSVYGPKSRR